MRSLIRPGIVGCIVLSVTLARAENWPQFRGPNGDGHSHEKGIPTVWSETENIAWKLAIAGKGHSSPVAWEGKVFVTYADAPGHDRRLMCVNAADGKVLWDVTSVYSDDLEQPHARNNYASSTPCVDSKAIYTSFYGNGRVNIIAHAHDGKPIWKAEPLPFEAEHGYCYTPAQTESLIILSVDQWVEPAIVAIEKESGAVRWRIDTPIDSCSNVPPLVIDSGPRPMVITCGNWMTRGIEPETGTVLWNFRGPTEYCAAGLAFGNGDVMITGGWPDRRVMVIDTTGSGDVTESHLRWQEDRGTGYVPSPIWVDGHFYSVTDNGIGMCFEQSTGEVLWKERFAGEYRTSLLLVEGNLWTTNEEGLTSIFKASPAGLEMVAENKLEGYYNATPAISDGRVFVRSETDLYCIAQPK